MKIKKPNKHKSQPQSQPVTQEQLAKRIEEETFARLMNDLREECMLSNNLPPLALMDNIRGDLHIMRHALLGEILSSGVEPRAVHDMLLDVSVQVGKSVSQLHDGKKTGTELILTPLLVFEELARTLNKAYEPEITKLVQSQKANGRDARD